MIIDLEGGTKLDFFKELYEQAKSVAQEKLDDMQKHFEQYKGSSDIDGSSVQASHVRNITYELVESQITTYLPSPHVTPKMWSEKYERNAKSVETLLNNKRDELPFEKLNDMDERFNPIYGGSVWLIEWDNSIHTHSTVGDVKITCLPPTKFIGQPNIFDVRDMEYCFITAETTKEDIMRKYNVSVEVAEETTSEISEDDKTATLIICYYKNEEDRVCEFVWSEDVILLDIDNYFSRKKTVCKKCGKRKEICECKKPEFVKENEDYEELVEDIQLSDGTVIPVMSEVVKDGEVVMEESTQTVRTTDGGIAFETLGNMALPMTEKILVPKMEKTRLPFYTPNILPVVIRKNTSQEDCLFGQSDCEFIRPEQQAINKIETRILQKLLRAGITPVVPEDAEVSINNSIFGQVIKMRPGQSANQYGTIDTTPNISQDIAAAERLYDHAKRILGITNSYQGQFDSSAQSGKAKQLQIQQAAGRLDSKRQMKNAAYAEIDQIIFQYYLAYADEPRPATYRDAQGRLQNYEFRRYDFIEKDDAGEWYYNDSYLFSTDASIDVERSKEMLWQENRQNFQTGAYGDPTQPQTQLIFWQNMEKAHYPWASDNVERIRMEIERQQEIAQYQQQIDAMGKENALLRDNVAKRAKHENELANEILANVRGGN
jgi:hypothetical protein